MFIDIHTHVSLLPFAGGAGLKTAFLSPRQLIDLYDEVGIDRGVLLPIVSPEGTEMIQSVYEVVKARLRHPDRLIPFCNVDPRQSVNSPDCDLSVLLEEYKAAGCKGVGEITANLWFDDPRVTNLFDHVQRCGLPLTFHVATREGNIYGLVDDLGLPRFEKQAAAHPDLIFLCHSQTFWSHISGDVSLETWGGYPTGPVTPGGRIPELMRRYPNIWGDLSAGSGANALSRDPDFGYAFLDEFQDRLLFGTDVNQVEHKDSVLTALKRFLEEGLASGGIARDVFDKVTHRNAIRLLGL